MHAEWVTALLDPAPTLVVHDGVNEAMSLMGADIKDVDGAATFRRRLVTPFRVPAPPRIACDHLPKDQRPGPPRRLRIRPQGQRARRSPAHAGEHRTVRAPHARRLPRVRDQGPARASARPRPPDQAPGKTYIGTLVVDDETYGPDFAMLFFAPKDDEDKSPPAQVVSSAELADIVHDVIAALPDHTVASARMLFAEMRKAGHPFRDTSIRQAVDDLLVAGRLTEVAGKRGAKGYQAVLTASQESSP